MKGRSDLKKLLGVFVLIGALAAPASAQMMSSQATSGMGNLQYYVGTWACMAGNVGQPPSHATARFTLDAGLLRQWVIVPAQGKMKSAYTLSIASTYDAKNHRFVQTGLGNDAGWWIDYAQPWSGTTEEWVDHASSNKLGRSETIRESQSRFSFTSWDAATGGKVMFKGYCTRSA
jgi:hypothetical protein